jgi:hypothetical protein
VTPRDMIEPIWNSAEGKGVKAFLFDFIVYFQTVKFEWR